MITALNLKWFYGLIFAFMAVMIIGVANEFYWILLLPVVLFIVLLGFYKLDTLMLFAVFITPISINLQQTGIGIGVSLPAEPIIFGIMIIFFLKLVYDGKFDKKIVTHPVSIVILLHLVWMCIATVFSSIPLVSVKATLARICFVSVFYFLATQLFINYKNILKFMWLYMIMLVVVIIITEIRHSAYNFDEQTAHYVMSPFYNDHTAYAVAIALFVPLVVAGLFDKTKSISLRFVYLTVFLVFMIAIVMCYTRAAWVSLSAALAVSLIFLFRVKTAIIIGLAAVFLAVVITQWTQIIIKLESNTERSSTDYREHLESISNISTDASNVERVNRWLCALRMFKERPVFGWGPGTYQFVYGPFQRNDEKTYISTNTGNRGSSHSEYLGPLSEYGLPGALFVIAIAIVTIYQSSRFIIKSKNKKRRLLAQGLIIGLVTYWVHGFLNYFLDTDKASVPFWGFIAALVALQVYHNKPEADDEKQIA